MDDISYNRGEVWLASLDPDIAEVTTRARLVMIVSTNTFNNGPAHLVVILPMTTRDHDIASHVLVSAPESGSNKAIYVLCERIQCVERDRLIKKIGRVSPQTMKTIDDNVATLLNLFPPN
jgi:mRNA interferase MazF